jgi:hypothetical protein
MFITLNPYSIGINKFIILFLFCVYAFNSTLSQNAIVTENLKTGVPATAWDIPGGTSGDLSIQGFATDISVNRGGTLTFKVDVNSGTDKVFDITIYRIGYYQGNGARLIADLGNFTGIAQNACGYNSTTGLTDCGNWTATASWAVPSTAVSGLYIAKLTRSAAGGGGVSHIAFIVRDDAGTSALLFKTSDATWQAYNNYGGNSLYVGTVPNFVHATKVSYNRPFLTRNGGGGGSAQDDWFMNAEYPMIRFLEKNGFDVSYTTDVDVSRSGSLLLNHKVFLSVGHDEYWSKPERDNVEAARAAGKHLTFFSGNEIYWKTRWENSTDGTNTPYRTMVCYKEGTLGENVCNGKCDPTTEWTGLWRDGCGYAGVTDACKPENALSGEISWDHVHGAIMVPDTFKTLRFWRNTPNVSTLSSGQTATLAPGSLGYEWDFEQYQSSYPPGRISMSSTILDNRISRMSLYKTSGGSLVFGAGTVQWSWGLDGNHDRNTGGFNVTSQDMQQATINLLADMGVQPATLQNGLVAATASADFTAPVTSITSPANGVTITSGAPITFSGTATDASTVAGVEISFDGGVTWNVAIGTAHWSYTWTPPGNGVYSIKARGIDDSGNFTTAAASATISITLNYNLTANCPCTVFGSTIPTVSTGRDNTTGIVLGMKFRPGASASVTGIRFYKASGNTGTHQGLLYNSSGVLLAQAVFTGETATGWQQVLFTTPVSVVAGQTYIAAYYSSAGYYSGTKNYFTTAIVNGPLTALADGTDGANGLYLYSTVPAFPVNTYQKSNYWVDLVFSSTQTAPVSNAGANQTIVLPASSVTLNGTASTGSITSYLWTRISGPNTPVITTPASVTTTVTGLIQGTYVFQLSVNNGASVSQVTVNVNPATSATTLFTTQTPAGGTGNEAPLELGVKFRAGVSGFVYGIRFYKTTGNTGTHTGELYSGTGTRLAQAVFTGETATGWQQVLFTTPVSVAAGQTYIAAYYSSAGYYTSTNNYFTSAVVNGPLTALADGTDGANGVYLYSPVPAFPVNTYQKSNYWVDLVFSSTQTAPVSNAGANQTIVLPASSVTLNGTASTGSITSYLWTQVSGPNTPVITTPASVTTTVTGLIQGTYVFQLSVNNGASVSQVTVNVNPATSATTIFTTQTPAGGTGNDSPLELGVKFRAGVSGFVYGIRFYKTTGNTGTHTGELYSGTGTRLAQAVFTGETATGWQQVLFTSPVSVAAGQTYIAAYYSSAGNYTSTNNYFTSAIVNGPLTALADGTDGANGVYLYSPVPAFPVNTYQKSNYWVDLVFSSTLSASVSNTGTNGIRVNPTTESSGEMLSYSLGQNYPNPFYQNTRIHYCVPSRAEVEIVLYDMQGRPVKLMVNEIKDPGNYDYDLNTMNLSKGIYFYRMRSVNYSAVKKLVIQ